MLLLRQVWRWWTESWRTPGRARVVYLVMTAGFAGLAIAAAIMGEAAVAAFAGVVAVVTAALAFVAPRLVEWTKHEKDVGLE